MGGHPKEPRPGPPPRLDEPVEILRHLRAQNLQRLGVARRIERERDFVFPETTVIMRDVWKYTLEIERREKVDAEEQTTHGVEFDADAILKEFA